MLVSFVIPAHNASQYLRQAIESCFTQTYAKVEVVVYDDGGNDLGNLGLSNQRLRIVTGPHLGYSKAFNAALAKTSGSVIAKLDADDFCYADRIASQLALLDRSDIVTCDAVEVDSAGAVIKFRKSAGMEPSQYLNGDISHAPTMPSVMASRRVFDAIGGMPEDADQGSDAGWAIRSLRAGFQWSHVPKPLYAYRIHGGQMTLRADGEMQLVNYRRYLNEPERSCHG